MNRAIPWFFFWSGLVVCSASAWAIYGGWDYYRLPTELRPRHAQHALLRSSGRYGLVAGIGGTAFFLGSLLYLIRKRLHGVRLGPLRVWMAFHIFAGVSGAALVTVHSAMLPRSALGLLASGGLAVVVVSGVVGRYIYAHIPRALSGRVLEREELARQLGEQRAQLRAAGFDAALLRTPDAGDPSRGVLRQIVGLAVGDRSAREAYASLRRAVRTRSDLHHSAIGLLPLARRHCRDQNRLARYRELRGLMRSWRFFHRWLAILMLILVVFHVVIAYRFGDLWVLR